MTTPDDTSINPDKGIFFAELDDDFQVLQGLSEAELLKRATCYFLLAPSTIVHPAYIWQSPMTHRLVHHTAAELVRPPFAQLELGKHSNISEYMGTRIEKLTRPSYPTRELREYELHGDRLRDEALSLDKKFKTALSRDVMSSNLRDKRFRQLLKEDLDRTRDFDQISLASRLRPYKLISHGSEGNQDLLQIMLDFVASADLVSVDTFLRRIYDEGFPALEADRDLRTRLLGLYYETYADEQTIIPATSKLLPGQVVNKYDADVFWGVMVRLFGTDCRLLADPSDPASAVAIRGIHDSADWPNFVALYFDTLATVDQALWEVPQQVIDRFAINVVPPKTRIFVLKKLWQSRKRDLAGIAFGAIASSTAAFQTVPTTVASAAGLAALGVGSTGMLLNIRRFLDSYRRQSLVRIHETIRHHVERAVADMQQIEP